MKTKLLLLTALSISALTARAQIFLDTNGATPGFGELNGTTWNAANTNWTTVAAGNVATSIWSNASGVSTFDNTNSAGAVAITLAFSPTSVSGISHIGSNAQNMSFAASTAQTITFGAGAIVNSSVSAARGITIGSNVSWSGDFSKTGVGSLTLSGAGTITGTIDHQAGNIRADTATKFTSATNLSMNGGTYQQNTGATAGTIGSLIGTSATSTITQFSNAASGTLIITQATTGTYAGVLGANAGTGTFSYQKTGAADLVLSGSNVFDGTMAINNGKLVAASNQALSNVSGATTSVANTAGAALQINSGVSLNSTAQITLSGANSQLIVGTDGATGTATIGGSLIASSGGIIKLDINGLAATDLLNVTGDQTFGGTVDFQLNNIGGSSFVANTWYTVINGSGLFTGTPSFTASVTPAGWSGFNSQIVGNDVQIQFTAIPEPSTLVMGLFALGSLLLVRRRAALAVRRA